MPFASRVFIAALALCAIAKGQQAVPLAYEKDIKPLLENYCFNCHGPERPRLGVNLERFTDLASIQKEPKLWRTVMLQLNTRAMPPENRPQPTPIERDRMIEFVHDSLSKTDFTAFPNDPGRITIRRLNRTEYNNTVRSLFDIVSAPADRFPADPAGGGGFDNNADVLFIPPILMERYLEAAKAVMEETKDSFLLVPAPSDTLSPHDAARQVLARFGPLIFRRTLTDADRDKHLRLFDQAIARGDSYGSAVRLMFRAMLVSPNFLFMVEKDRDSADAWPVGSFELATRLSYFLWSDAPDDELLAAAADGSLLRSEVLAAHTRRMLADDRGRAVATYFGTQWLGIRELLTSSAPDPNRFPDYSAPLRDAMYNEAIFFLDSVFREDVSLITLLDADYLMVNDDLARHYGLGLRALGGFRGEDLRRVKIESSPRGGILGLAAVHVVTSYPLRTSPVLRGKWILDTVLGSPPPPPPPDAGELPQDDKQADGLTFRQRLEKHRTQPQCASCHNRLDPPGFALENFDPIGKWRDQDNGKPIDSSGTLATGQKVDGPGELKKAILDEKEAFVRNLTERMLSYSLGRGLEVYDQRAVELIVQKVKAADYRSSVLFTEITGSYPFRYRRQGTVVSGQ